VPAHQEGEMITKPQLEQEQAIPKITSKEVAQARETLMKYKEGKKNLENKIIENEQWWKLRHWEQARDESKKFTPATAWLFNVIASKHASMEDGYPEANILPRERNDEIEAKKLSDIVPVVMEQSEFHKTYSDACWYKLKQGACIYGIFWDAQKHNGLGDISIKKVDAISLFWQPGITDIQKSRNIFHCELVDNDLLKQQYPQLTEQSLASDVTLAKYMYDDTVDTSDKSTVVDWYYHTAYNGKKVLHYCKFVGDTVLYASENETTPFTEPVIDPETGMPAVNPETGNTLEQVIKPSIAETGWYEHGLYPFVVDSLFDIEGSPFGYGYTDICKDTQIIIDQLNSAITRNALMAAKPRYLRSDQCDINEDEFSDWEKDVITVTGNMNENTLQQISVNPMSSICMDFLNHQITMLKETSGNRDVNNGGTQTGITAASALAIMQEQGNRLDRDCISTTYEAYKQIVLMVVELIRQFYDVPRQFRILGDNGSATFVDYDNRAIKPQYQGVDFGRDMGYRLPLFDISVSAQKATPYNKLSQNELALQFYNLGFFVPQNATQASACLNMMDFDGKEEVVEMVQQNGTIMQAYQQLLNLAMAMANKFDPSVVPMIAQGAMAVGVNAQLPVNQQGEKTEMVNTDAQGNLKSEEHPFVEKARERVQQSTQPN
jgi:hypothetical protein